MPLSEDLSARYYQNKKLIKNIKAFLKKQKKRKPMVVSNAKIYQKIKNKSFLSIEKKLKREKKALLKKI